MHTNDDVFDDFPKISEDFPKIFQKLSEGQKTFPNIFRKFPKIAEDNRRFPRKNRSCFDHTATHLRTF